MFTRLLGLLPLAALLAPAVAADDPKPKDAKDAPAPKWAVHGLSVMKPLPAVEKATGFDKIGPGTGATPWGTNEGTRVVTRLELPGRALLGYQQPACRVESMTDDKGTDLLVPPADAKGAAQRINGYQFAAGGGSSCAFDFYAAGLPAPGATKVRLKAKVLVVVASGEKEAEKKDASLKAGVELACGTLSLAEADGFGGPSPVVSYKGTKPLKQLTLLDPDGKEVTLRRSTAPLPSARQVDAGRDFTARFLVGERRAKSDTKLDRCTVRATYYDTVEPVTLPVELEAGLGL